MDELGFIKSVLKLVSDLDASDQLFWKVENNEVKFFVICNDAFYWATADGEEITPNNFRDLLDAVHDIKNATTPHRRLDQALLLFCARVRKMRPQGAMYKYIVSDYWSLFDACGPERKIDMFNPKAPSND